MSSVKSFADFGIRAEKHVFIGDKVKIPRILNKQIEVHAFKIEPSKFEGQRLRLAISVGETRNIVFTSSTVLMDMIQRVPEDGFPFTTTIIADNERYQFT